MVPSSTPSSPSLGQTGHLPWAHPFYIVVALILLVLLRNKFQPGLRHIPGPSIAAYTRYWRVYDVWRGHAHLTAIKLHRKYGTVVRTAPNVVQISDASFIPIIYSIKENFTKTAFFPIQSISWGRKPEMNLFSAQDPIFHRSQKRQVGAAFSMPNLLQSEDSVDLCVSLFMDRLQQLTANGTAIDLGAWLQFYAFDVVGQLTFGRSLGFLEQGKDVDGMISAIQGVLKYAAICGQVPEWHRVLLGNPLIAALMPAMETQNQVLVFTLQAINERASIQRDGELIKADTEGRDMMSKWAYVKSGNPDKMSTRDIGESVLACTGLEHSSYALVNTS